MKTPAEGLREERLRRRSKAETQSGAAELSCRQFGGVGKVWERVLASMGSHSPQVFLSPSTAARASP